MRTIVYRTLGCSSGAAGIASHGDGLGLLLDVLEEGEGAGQLPSVDGLGSLSGVLEGNAEVGAAGASRLRGVNLCSSVSNLRKVAISHQNFFLAMHHILQQQILSRNKGFSSEFDVGFDVGIVTYHLDCCVG